MSINRYASLNGTKLVWYSSQPSAERDGDTWTYRFRAWCLRSSVFSLVPVSGTAITNAAFNASASSNIPVTGITTTNLELTGVSVMANPSPEMVDVEFSFKYSDVLTGTWMGHYNGEIEQRSETTVRDVPTKLAYEGPIPDLVNAAIEAAAADIDTVPVPGLKYYYSTYTTSFGWSEAELIAVSGISIAEVGAPTGIDTPTANKWLLQGKSIENVGAGMVKVSEEWEYSPIDWN
jgi:hypothetical protein